MFKMVWTVIQQQKGKTRVKIQVSWWREWHDSLTRFTDSLLICSYFLFMQPTHIDDQLNPNSYWTWHLQREHSFIPLLLTHQIIIVICHFLVTATLSLLDCDLIVLIGSSNQTSTISLLPRINKLLVMPLALAAFDLM
jgi:hypothetical protein